MRGPDPRIHVLIPLKPRRWKPGTKPVPSSAGGVASLFAQLQVDTDGSIGPDLTNLIRRDYVSVMRDIMLPVEFRT